MIKSTKKSRWGTAAVFGAVVALVLSGCATDSGADEKSSGYVEATSGELNFYTWSDYYPQELIDKFKEDTGITINIDYYDTNESLEAKLRASNGAGYDVVVPGDYMVQIMVSENMLEPLDWNIGGKIARNEKSSMNRTPRPPGPVCSRPQLIRLAMAMMPSSTMRRRGLALRII